MNCGLKIEEGELPANYTNMHEKRIKAVLLFRYPAIQPSSYPAIQPSSLVFRLRNELVCPAIEKPWAPPFVIVTDVTMFKANKRGLFAHNPLFFIDLWRPWLHFLQEFRLPFL